MHSMHISVNIRTCVYLILATVLTACASNEQKPPSTAFTETGKASYYADSLHGNLTANGETFNQNALTAAHPRLAFGTQVRVTNMANGKSVVVRINDRGPFTRGRVIDLSKTAFAKIGNTRVGILDVRIDTL